MKGSGRIATSRERSPHAVNRAAALIAVLLLACIAPAIFGQQNVHAVLIASADRKPAPSFHLEGETGKKTQISDYRGKVVLLNFWATDCGGCILEIPSFIDLQGRYQDKGFTAVGISVDISYEQLKNAGEAWGKVRPFVQSHKINYPILMGDQSISQTYQLTAISSHVPHRQKPAGSQRFMSVSSVKRTSRQISIASCRSRKGASGTVCSVCARFP